MFVRLRTLQNGRCHETLKEGGMRIRDGPGTKGSRCGWVLVLPLLKFCLDRGPLVACGRPVVPGLDGRC